MKETMGIFESIKNTSGANAKQAILKASKSNNDFTRLLHFLYNPYEVTGIGRKKMDKFKDFHSTYITTYDSFFEVISMVLSYDGSVSDRVVQNVANYINSQEEEVREFLREVITKDYKCGVTASTINKVYGKGFIPKHEIMLAKSWGDEERKVKGDFIVTEKFDGIRCTVIKEDGEIEFLTRKGLPILGLVELAEEFKLLRDNTVFDGELLNVNRDGLDSKTLFRKTQQRVRKDGEKRDIEFHMYDMLSLSEFKKGKSDAGALSRKEFIFYMLKNLGLSAKYIKHVPLLYVGSDKEEVMRLLSEAVKQGKEGVMVNLVDGKYECKRSSNILKAKEFKSVDLRVTDVEVGSGKFAGVMGNVVVDYKGQELRVGSGFSDAQRKLYWDNPNDIIGSIIEVKYFEESENENGGESLRFPTFAGLRDDKDEVSYHA